MKKTSAIYINYIWKPDVNSYTCKLCDASVSKFTTNLKTHIQNNHKDAWIQYEKAESLKAQKRASTNHILAPVSAKQLKLDNFLSDSLMNDCVDLVTINARPFEIFNDKGMKNIIKKARENGSANKFQAINPANVKQNVIQKANESRKLLKKEISKKMLSLKLDFATCMYRSFYAMNVQYLDKDDNIKVKVLECKEVMERHTAENISLWIRSTIENFDILGDQILAITTDTAANMKAGVRKFVNEQECAEIESENFQVFYQNDIGLELQNEIPEEDFSDCSSFVIGNDDSSDEETLDLVYEDVSIVDLDCCAHVIQLAVNSFLDKNIRAQKIVKFCQKLSAKLKTPIMSSMLKSQGYLQSIVMHKVRWSWTFFCLERLLKLQNFCSSNQEIFNCLKVSLNMWASIQELSLTLEPVATLTKKIQSQNLDVPSFIAMWKICKLQLSNQNNYFSNALLQNINSRESQIFSNSIVNASKFLDKRFSFELDIEKASEAKFFIKALHQKILKVESFENDSYSVNEIQESNINDDNLILLEDSLKEQEQILSQNISMPIISCSSIDVEMSKYEQLSRCRADENIRQKWMLQKHDFPLLSKVALLILSVPLTEVSVERLFSFLNLVLDPQRNRLNSDILNDYYLSA